MAYPNEHAARQREPGEFEPDSFRRKEVAPGISMIVGKLKHAPPGHGGSMVVQSVRMAAQQHTVEEAKEWLDKNGFTGASFEEATNKGPRPMPGVQHRKSDDGDGMLRVVGGAVKSDGGRKISGYLITFSGPEDPDTSRYRDFFTKSTDYVIDEWPAKTPILFHHTLHPSVQDHRLGWGMMKMDEQGVFVEAVLNEHDTWAEKIMELQSHKSKVTGAPPLYWSSGTAQHLVRREEVKTSDGFANWVKKWPLGIDASLTHTPAEPRNGIVSIKSAEIPDLDSMLDSLTFPVGERPSLAERTERWLEMGEELAVGYREVLSAQIKIGKPMSDARMKRLKAAYEQLGSVHVTIGDIMSECVGTSYPGTGSASIPAQPCSPQMEKELLRLKMQGHALLNGSKEPNGTMRRM